MKSFIISFWLVLCFIVTSLGQSVDKKNINLNEVSNESFVIDLSVDYSQLPTLSSDSVRLIQVKKNQFFSYHIFTHQREISNNFTAEVNNQNQLNLVCQGPGIDILCPSIYDPVCGCDGVTYNNGCEALRAGVYDATSGPCGDTGGGDGEDECIGAGNPSQICPQNIDPVCGCDGVEYNNECFAFRAGVLSTTPGPCGNGGGGEDECIGEGNPSQICPQNIDPVCGCDGVEYNNECFAFRAGVKSWTQGPCSTGPDVCELPANLFYNADQITQNGALLSVTNGSPTFQYRWQYRIEGTLNWQSTTTGNSPELRLSSLTDCTTYEWRVEISCSNGLLAGASGIFKFETICASCVLPANLFYEADQITENSVRLSAVNGSTENEYLWQYRIKGNNLQWKPIFTGNSPGTTLAELLACTTYEWRVRVRCANGITPGFSSVFEFTTSCGSCVLPTNLFYETGQIEENSAQLSVVNGSVENRYLWQYKVKGSSQWELRSTGNVPNITLIGLFDCSTYEWRVEIICSNGFSSGYSNIFEFTTACRNCVDESIIDQNILCPALYDPVCGCDGKTYPSGCAARNYYGITEYTPGPCNTNICIDPSKISNNQCPAIYDPVCGCDGVTYGNECSAGNAGVISWTKGPCQENCEGEKLDIQCPLNIDPVCGCNGVTYNNECEALKDGVIDFTRGPCADNCIGEPSPNLNCPQIFDPVCGCDGIEYSNECFAIRAGVQRWEKGPCASVCQLPTNLQYESDQIGENSARLRVINGSTENRYFWQWRVRGTTQWQSRSTGNSPILILNGLLDCTTYEWRVEIICTNGVSFGFSSDFEFTTTCTNCELPIDLQYESDQITETSAKLKVINSLIGNQHFWQYRVKGTSQWRSGNSGNIPDLPLSNLLDCTTYEWRVEITCENGISTGFSRVFEFTTTCANCILPANLIYESDQIGENSARLRVINGSNENRYFWQWRIKGTSQWQPRSTGNTPEIILAGLLDCTAYEWRVEIICANGISAGFSSIAEFTTTCANCTLPVNLVYESDQVRENSARLRLINGSNENRYFWQWRIKGTSQWQPRSTGNTPEIILTGLLDCTTYEWRVEIICANGISAGFSSIAEFTTICANCTLPANLVYESDQVRENSARLRVINGSNENRYFWQWRIKGTSQWQFGSTGNLPRITLTGLLDCATYEWRVEIICANGVSAGFSSIFELKTVCASCVDESIIDQNILCPSIYDPVCGCDGKTYPSGCSASNYYGITEYTPGPCNTNICIDPAQISDNPCPAIADPVCGCDGVTYGNECSAENAGVISWTRGPCQENCEGEKLDIECPLNIDPVCGCNGITYNNECEAFRDGVIDFSKGACVDNCIGEGDPNLNCPAIFDPVCGCDGVEYSNECFAIRAGVQRWEKGPCARVCQLPENLFYESDQIGENSARLRVINGSTENQYFWQWRVKGTSGWQSRSTGNAPAIILSGLLDCTTYEWQVEIVCSNGISAGFSSIIEFTTVCASCVLPANLSYESDQIGENSARLRVINGSTENSYLWQWRVRGTAQWQSRSTGNVPEIILTELQDCTTYEWQVEIICSNGVSAGFSSIFEFTTVCASCVLPANLLYESDQLGENSARLRVINGSTENSYLWQWRARGTAQWQSRSTGNVPEIILTGLEECTTYQWRVEIICTNGVSAGVSRIFEFTTDCASCILPGNLSYELDQIGENRARLRVINGSTENRYLWQWRARGITQWQSRSTGNVPEIILTGLLDCTAYEWRVEIVCFNDVSNEFSSIFEFTTTCATCALPADLSYESEQIGANGLRLRITNGSTENQYFWQWRIKGTEQWESKLTDNLPEINLLSLQSCATYEWQLEIQCPNGLLSDLSEIFEFETACLNCILPEEFQYFSDQISESGARLNILNTNIIAQYIWQYRIKGTVQWESSNTINTSSFNLINLRNCTVYEWRVVLICANGERSNSSEIFEFETTCLDCTFNENLQFFATQVIANSAQLEVLNGNDLDQYKWQYRIKGTSFWRSISRTDESKLSIVNLQDCTSYEWRVEIICANGISGGFSDIYDFTTICIECQLTDELKYEVDRIEDNQVRLRVINSSLLNSYIWQYRPKGDSTWIQADVTDRPEYFLENLQDCTIYEWRVAIICANSSSSGFSDNSSFSTKCAECNLPSNIFYESNQTSENSITLKVTDGIGEQYTWQYRRKGDALWLFGGQSFIPEFTITDLNECETYEWRVGIVCTNNVSAGISGAFEFTMNCESYTIPDTIFLDSEKTQNGLIKLIVTNGSPNSFYNWQYRLKGNSQWQLGGQTENPMITLGNLEQCEVYEWRVSILCVNGSTTNLSNTSDFSTDCTVCPNPNDLLYESKNLSSASTELRVFDENTGNQYTWQFRIKGESAWVSGGTTDLPTLVLNDLQECVNYEWRVEITCENNTTSGWSNVFEFLADCSPCSFNGELAYETSNIVETGVTLSVENAPTDFTYEWQIREKGRQQWTTLGETTNTAIQLGNLIGCSDYEWRVRLICPNDERFDFSGIYEFTTLCPTCSFTSDMELLEASINKNSLTIRLLNSPIDATYLWQYKESERDFWISQPISGDSVLILENLTPCTSYEYRVRVFCSNGLSTDYSASMSSKTLCDGTDQCNFTLSLSYEANENNPESIRLLVSGDSSLSDYYWRYRVLGQQDWMLDTTSAPILELDSLEDCASYESQVSVYCDQGQNLIQSNLLELMSPCINSTNNLFKENRGFFYANPFTDCTTLKLINNNSINVRIFDINGRVLHQGAMEDGQELCNDVFKEKGVYFAELQFGDVRVFQKLMKL